MLISTEFQNLVGTTLSHELTANMKPIQDKTYLMPKGILDLTDGPVRAVRGNGKALDGDASAVLRARGVPGRDLVDFS